MKKLLFLLLLALISISAKAQVNDSVFIEVKNRHKEQIDSLVKVIHKLNTDLERFKQNVKIDKKVTFYELKYLILGDYPENAELFKGVEVLKKKEVKLNKKQLEKLRFLLVSNATPPIKSKCPMAPEYAIVLKVDGKRREYIISFSCGNMIYYSSEYQEILGIKDKNELKIILDEMLK